jgi:protein-S-isoprenylcysteine O-methyltransferase Ste14
MTASLSPIVPWWKGRRGEWYVLIQIGLLLLVVAGPRTAPGLPAWPSGIHWLSSIAGAVLMACGLLWAIAGGAGLGANLTPLPYPRDESRLIETGAYALVRHPMYCGGIWAAVGWALWVQGLLTLGYAVVLFVFADYKASREERWLCAKFPEYASYQKRVRKLIPFIY